MEVTISDVMNILKEMKSEIKDVKSQMTTKDDLGGLEQRIDQRINTLDKKFESKFDLLFDAVGDINEKFTVMDYKFLQLKRQVHAT
jgi:predicted  nucleic acid-binding Zn-ribbon protein